jgi:hypothetical protein
MVHRRCSFPLRGSSRRAARPPNGDELYVAAGGVARETFTVADLLAFPGYGVVLGDRDPFGAFCGARSQFDTVCNMICFGSAESGQAEDKAVPVEQTQA